MWVTCIILMIQIIGVTSKSQNKHCTKNKDSEPSDLEENSREILWWCFILVRELHACWEGHTDLLINCQLNCTFTATTASCHNPLFLLSFCSISINQKLLNAVKIYLHPVWFLVMLNWDPTIPFFARTEVD